MKDLEKSDDYYLKTIEKHDLIMYKKRIYIPKVLRERIMEWYHIQLVHPGSTRMISTIQASMYWHGMRKDVEQYVKTCDVCQ